MTKTTTIRTSRQLAASKHKMEDAADRWSDIYDSMYPLLLEFALNEASSGVTSQVGDVVNMENLIKNASARAMYAADVALDEYEQRWPGV